MRKETRLAIALQYAAEQNEAPRVIAAGRGRIAERMVAAAGDSRVPVYQDKALAAVLAELETGTEIPPELYQAVAQVLVFVWNLDRRSAKGEGTGYEG